MRTTTTESLFWVLALTMSVGFLPGCGGDDPTKIEPMAEIDTYLAELPD